MHIPRCYLQTSGLSYDLNINQFFIKNNFFKNIIENNNNFLFYRKNYINIMNNKNIENKYYLKPYLNNILSAENVFNNSTIFEKLTHKYKYKYNASLF
jgi:hypothetical protein